jgi:hypothetical protein
LGPLLWYCLVYLLTATGLTPGGSSTVHIYTKTIYRSGIPTQSGQTKINDELTVYKSLPNWEVCWPCHVFASYTLAFALQLTKNHRKTSDHSVHSIIWFTKKDYAFLPYG